MKASTVAAIAAVVLLALASPAHALDADSELVRSLSRQVSRTLVVPEAAAPSPVAARDLEPLDRIEAPATPSKAFPILATTYVALNALDVYTTVKAVNSGRGVEANPALSSVASTPAALVVAKIATTATTLVIAKHLWKEHRTASVVLMVAANIGTGFIVGHNAQVAGHF